MKRHLFLYLVMVCWLPLWGQYTIQSLPNPHHADRALFVANPDGILSAGGVQEINQVCQRLHAATDVEMVVVAVDAFEGADAADFTYRLFNYWGIGEKGKNTGVLLFISTYTRDVRITTGGGVEGLLPDALCSDIVSEQMVPLLSQGNWDGGMLAGARQVARTLTTTEAQAELLLGYRPQPVNGGAWDGLCGVCLMYIFLMILKWLFTPICPHCGKRGVEMQREVVQEPTYKSQGIAVVHNHCPHCHKRWDKNESLPRLTHSSAVPVIIGGGGRGGGFSGGSFGGGVSFGGGAGGKF